MKSGEPTCSVEPWFTLQTLVPMGTPAELVLKLLWPRKNPPGRLMPVGIERKAEPTEPSIPLLAAKTLVAFVAGFTPEPGRTVSAFWKYSMLFWPAAELKFGRKSQVPLSRISPGELERALSPSLMMTALPLAL